MSVNVRTVIPPTAAGVINLLRGRRALLHTFLNGTKLCLLFLIVLRSMM